jgi:signal transduction histidine kinase
MLHVFTINFLYQELPPRTMALSHAVKTFWTTRYGYALALIATIIVVGGAGYGYLQQQKRIIFSEKCNELTTIADLKSAQIVQWRKERLAEATSIHANAMMSHRVNDFLNNVERVKALAEIRAWMTSLHDNAGYSKVSFFKPDGELITSVPDENEPLNVNDRNLIAAAVKKCEVVFSDFDIDDNAGTIDIDLFIPLLYSDGSRSRCIAVLVLEIDPQKYLYPLIQSWPTPSKTAETLLVERNGTDVLYLNQLRFRKQASLTFRLPLSRKDLPAARAVLGQEGLFSGTDYRGVSVLSAIRTIPGSPWAMVAKVDSSEIYAPVARRSWYVAAICVIVVIAINLGISLWWIKKKEAYLHKLYDAELKYSNDLRRAERLLLEARNELEQRVSERTRELSDVNSNLKQEISERVRLEQQLFDAKKLESIGQLAGGVAHEVRNPLNAILSITEALFREKEIENNPEFAPFITHIRTQVTRLADLMNDLLDLGKAIPTSSLQPVPLHELCSETITIWKSSGSAANKQIELVCDEDHAHLLVLADSTKLQQVLFNLIENAAQHSPPASIVRFSILRTDSPDNSGSMAIMHISDEGRGIAPDKIVRIFDPFFSDRKGGTGLGLALVKHFIENMAGTVRIWNNDPPPGCTAEIRIPRAREEHP